MGSEQVWPFGGGVGLSARHEPVCPTAWETEALPCARKRRPGYTDPAGVFKVCQIFKEWLLPWRRVSEASPPRPGPDFIHVWLQDTRRVQLLKWIAPRAGNTGRTPACVVLWTFLDYSHNTTFIDKLLVILKAVIK